MSAYIVLPETIARLSNLIAYANYNRWTFEMPESIHKELYFCKNRDGFFDPKKICKALAILNYQSVDGLYNRNTTQEEIESYYNECISLLDDNWIKSPEWTGYGRNLTHDHYQLYMNLMCFNYQCDSDCTQKEPIFQAMKELETYYSKWILSNTKEINECKWQ